jgi:hypothetical protein
LPPHCRQWALLMIAPHRSVRLAKMSLHRTPIVIAAQNVLLKKLGFLES